MHATTSTSAACATPSGQTCSPSPSSSLLSSSSTVTGTRLASLRVQPPYPSLRDCHASVTSATAALLLSSGRASGFLLVCCCSCVAAFASLFTSDRRLESSFLALLCACVCCQLLRRQRSASVGSAFRFFLLECSHSLQPRGTAAAKQMTLSHHKHTLRRETLHASPLDYVIVILSQYESLSLLPDQWKVLLRQELLTTT